MLPTVVLPLNELLPRKEIMSFGRIFPVALAVGLGVLNGKFMGLLVLSLHSQNLQATLPSILRSRTWKQRR